MQLPTQEKSIAVCLQCYFFSSGSGGSGDGIFFITPIDDQNDVGPHSAVRPDAKPPMELITQTKIDCGHIHPTEMGVTDTMKKLKWFPSPKLIGHK